MVQMVNDDYYISPFFVEVSDVKIRLLFVHHLQILYLISEKNCNCSDNEIFQFREFKRNGLDFQTPECVLGMANVN